MGEVDGRSPADEGDGGSVKTGVSCHSTATLIDHRLSDGHFSHEGRRDSCVMPKRPCVTIQGRWYKIAREIILDFVCVIPIEQLSIIKESAYAAQCLWSWFPVNGPENRHFLMAASPDVSDLTYHTERVAARARDNYICQYCDKYPEFVTTDHVVPRSRGGTHDRNNLVCCCADCNGKKNDFTPQEWYERLTLESNQALSPSDRLYRRIDNLENRFGVELRPLQLLLPLPLEKQIFTLAA